MYNEAGKWECKIESDCFECPYPDCIKTQGYLKKMKKRPDVNALLDNRYRIEVGEKHSYREE